MKISTFLRAKAVGRYELTRNFKLHSQREVKLAHIGSACWNCGNRRHTTPLIADPGHKAQYCSRCYTLSLVEPGLESHTGTCYTYVEKDEPEPKKYISRNTIAND